MNIVVGFVFGTEAQAALERAKEEARLRNARLIVVHSARGGAHESDDELANYSEALSKVDADLGAAGIEHELTELILGNDPADDIINIAEESNADMIVIGLRRRSKVGKLILGSTAQDVLLGADCAVLAVKPSAAR